MTPEEIVGLIGNIGNRPDIREIQERQIKEIYALIEKTNKDMVEAQKEVLRAVFGL